MSGVPLRTVLDHLRAAVRSGEDAALTDAELVRRFAISRDPAAFELLFWRHGAMVAAVCRRVLRHEQDAEDAFQATFLVLARKARSIGNGEAVGSWLYKVAYRTALKARTRQRSRHDREAPLRETAQPEVRPDQRELGALLDEAVHQLPDRFRSAFVLCYFQGKSVDEAAMELRCARGTVMSRLFRARQRVRRRLTRRGVAVPATLVAGTAAEATLSAAMPPLVLRDTLHAALAFAAGAGGSTNAIPTRITTLTQGVLQQMFVAKLQRVTVVLLVGILTLCGLGLLWHETLGAGPDGEPGANSVAGTPAAQPAPKLQAPGTNKLVFTATVDGKRQIHIADLAGGKGKQVTKDAKHSFVDPVWSPDGKKILCRRLTTIEPGEVGFSELMVIDADGGNVKALTNGASQGHFMSWSPDGTKILYQLNTGPGTVICVADADGNNQAVLSNGSKDDLQPTWSPDGKKIIFSRGGLIHTMNRDGTNQVALTKFGGAADTFPVFSPDGTKIAMISYRGGEGGPRLYVMDADGANIKQLSTAPGEHRACYPAWSPDSKKIAYSDNGPADWEIFVVNSDGTGHKQLTKLGSQNLHVSWSPDGKKLAFLHLQGGKSVPNHTEIYVMDADGGNQKVLHGDSGYLLYKPMWQPHKTGAAAPAGKEKDPPQPKIDPLKISVELPKQPPTLSDVNGGEYRFKVVLENTGKEDLIVWPYLKFKLLNGQGQALKPVKNIGRWGIVKNSPLEDTQFKTLKPNDKYTIEVNLADYYYDPNAIVGYTLPALGEYKVAFTYHYNAAEVKKAFGIKAKDVDNPTKIWNRAHETKQEFEVKLKLVPDVPDKNPAGNGGNPNAVQPPANVPPQQRAPEVTGTIETVVPATDAEKKLGFVGFITLKDRKEKFQLTTKTAMQFSKGKLVEPAAVTDIKKGDSVGVWMYGGPGAQFAASVEMLMIFRPGTPSLPPIPGGKE